MTSLSYRSQVLYLRKLAVEALKSYSIKVKKIEFIQHGENTTFRIHSFKSESFLLRIHRSDYHSDRSIAEELSWIKYLRENSTIDLPSPFANKSGSFHIKVYSEREKSSRVISILKWVEGRFFAKSLTLNKIEKTAELMSEMHMTSAKYKTKERFYWDSEGLVGKSPSIGMLTNIYGASEKQQYYIDEARKKVFKKLKSYEKKNPNKLGMIHADLHFGNMLWSNSRVSPIDFDDCGYGFHMYDLAVTIDALENGSRVKKMNKRELKNLKNTFLNSYDLIRGLSQCDVDILPYFIIARRLFGVAWINSRQDNPRLKSFIKSYLDKAVLLIKKENLI